MWGCKSEGKLREGKLGRRPRRHRRQCARAHTRVLECSPAAPLPSSHPPTRLFLVSRCTHPARAHPRSPHSLAPWRPNSCSTRARSGSAPSPAPRCRSWNTTAAQQLRRRRRTLPPRRSSRTRPARASARGLWGGRRGVPSLPPPLTPPTHTLTPTPRRAAYFARLGELLSTSGARALLSPADDFTSGDGLYIYKRPVRSAGPEAAAMLASGGSVFHHVVVYVKRGERVSCRQCASWPSALHSLHPPTNPSHLLLHH